MLERDMNARPLPWADIILSSLLALLLVGGLIGSIYSYHSVRSFVLESQLPIFPSADASAEDPLPAPVLEGAAEPPGVVEEPIASNPVPAMPEAVEEDAVMPPPATERLTILLMGIDRRDGEQGPWRTDSMILLSIDPETNSVAMLSTPRDMWVTIPDYGYGEHLDRINTAYFHGDDDNYPGGGAALAKQTIRRNFGIEVDRYLVMDFNGFRQVIDYIGGINVVVPDLLVDDQYPTEDYGYMSVRFEEGRQHMDGERALIYSRTRKSTSDFARAERQQQVILAVRDKVLSLDILPSLTPSNVARLIGTMNESIETDLSLDEMLSLAQVAQKIESDRINRLVIDQTLVRDYTTEAGAQVLLPRWNEILPMVEEIFEQPLLAIAPTPVVRPVATVAATAAATNQEDGDNRRNDGPARVAVWNGTSSEGLEQTIASDLRNRGYNVTNVGRADRNDYPRTFLLVYNAEMTDLVYQLQEHYNLSDGDIWWRDGADNRVDVAVIVGFDELQTSSGGAVP